MAALPAGVQYELSSESNNEGNKELVFVKLTDSALKAIEEFLIQQKKGGSAKPKIQFLPGNEGKISIPAVARGNDHGLSGETKFHFSINSNAEMEGTRGSFGCITSGNARRLESCGPLPRRMRVNANDDSYAVTRYRIASTIAAEQKKSIRVIKSNEADIGNPNQTEWREGAKRLVPKRTEQPVPPVALPGGRAAWSMPAGAPSRDTAAAASVTVLPDEPPHKKRRVSYYRSHSPPSSGFVTTSSRERQVEDLRRSPVNLKTAVIDDLKKIALRNVFGRRLNIC